MLTVYSTGSFGRKTDLGGPSGSPVVQLPSSSMGVWKPRNVVRGMYVHVEGALGVSCGCRSSRSPESAAAPVCASLALAKRRLPKMSKPKAVLMGVEDNLLKITFDLPVNLVVRL
jgi:hypothetical protein